jgi:L-arabinonolactonase
MEMPVKNIASLCFGDPNLDKVFVTSMTRVSHPAAHDLFTKQNKPQFNTRSLFRVTGLGIKGLPEPAFTGS